MRVLAPCGTERAYRQHLRRGEKPCEPCRRSNAAAASRRAARPEYAEQLAESRRKAQERKRQLRAARRPSELDRLLSRVSYADNGCWHWTGGISTSNGYGRAWLRGSTRSAHVAMYMVVKGEVPDDYQVDHTCHNIDRSCPGGADCMHRRCVNPHHLEAVTRSVNQIRQGRRKTHCPRGHEYTPANTRLTRGNARSCRRCHADRQTGSRAA